MLKMDYFWAETINTFFDILNCVSIRNDINKTLYELLKNIKPSISYFHIFAWYCYIVNNKEKSSKFDSKSNNDIFLEYYTTSNWHRDYKLKPRQLNN